MIQEQIITTIDEIQGMLATLAVQEVIDEGGAGSGHWGHKGRKGKKGGSLGGGLAGKAPKKYVETKFGSSMIADPDYNSPNTKAFAVELIRVIPRHLLEKTSVKTIELYNDDYALTTFAVESYGKGLVSKGEIIHGLNDKSINKIWATVDPDSPDSSWTIVHEISHDIYSELPNLTQWAKASRSEWKDNEVEEGFARAFTLFARAKSGTAEKGDWDMGMFRKKLPKSYEYMRKIWTKG